MPRPRVPNKPDFKADDFSKYSIWKRRVYEVIFEADTPAGKFFDVALLILIVTSVAVICVETLIPEENQDAVRPFFLGIEVLITICFTVEYGLRIWCVKHASRYIFSFYGVVDLLSILPTYAALVFGTGTSFAVLRIIRLMRVFRVLKLVWLLSEADELASAVWQARAKIVVFLSVLLIAVTIAGSAMYELEKDNFESIPHGMYWAIVTMTTVGYGDLVPQTWQGKLLSAALILLGYSLIIVPTGFVSAEFIRQKRASDVTTQVCSHCMREGHDADAVYCKYCGRSIN